MSERSYCDEATAEHRRELCGRPCCTINGRPAIICGALLRFAIVSDRESGLSCEYSWQAVENVLAKGGAFTVG